MFCTQKLQIYKREGNMFSCLVFKKHYCYKLGNILGKKDFFYACLFLIKAHIFIRKKKREKCCTREILFQIVF